jgi:hypothetical protein
MIVSVAGDVMGLRHVAPSVEAVGVHLVVAAVAVDSTVADSERHQLTRQGILKVLARRLEITDQR